MTIESEMRHVEASSTCAEAQASEVNIGFAPQSAHLAAREHQLVQVCRRAAAQLATGQVASRTYRWAHLVDRFSFEARQVVKLQQQEASHLVTIGSQVTWYPKSERWRIEIIHPSAMKAAFIRHDVLVGIAKVDSHNPEVVAGLVQIHRMEIEEVIVMAELQSWPDKLGVLPQGIDGVYQR